MVRFQGSGRSGTLGRVTISVIENELLLDADTEYAVTLPVNVKRFK